MYINGACAYCVEQAQHGAQYNIYAAQTSRLLNVSETDPEQLFKFSRAQVPSLLVCCLQL
jgi:hypothetical protein